MNVLIFDTETTDINKCFCYDLGYCILNTETKQVIKKRHFIIKQIWYNLPLFESAYYKDKREKYVSLLRARKTELVYFGQATQALCRDIKKYQITSGYAYNCGFDDKVFTYNCEWYHVINPLEIIPIFDIWGYASEFITTTDEYKCFCEKHERFTDSGNYKGSAEVVYQYLFETPSFEEAHMGLMDSEIETEILLKCIEIGAKWDTEYKIINILPRIIPKSFTVKVDGKVIYEGEYIKKYIRKDCFSFTTPSIN